MELKDYKIEDGKIIIIRKSDLTDGLELLLDKMSDAKMQDDFVQWTFLAGQVQTIQGILKYFDITGEL